MTPEAARLLADFERLRGKPRIAVRHTQDGLGIHVPPARNVGQVLFICLWLVAWGAGMKFGMTEFFAGGITITSLFLLIWLVPWTLAGLAVTRLILWQLLGVERLYVTAGALVRERALLGMVDRRVLEANDIASVGLDVRNVQDFFGLGMVEVKIDGGSIRIGNRLDFHEAELLAGIVSDALVSEKMPPTQPG